MNSSHSITIFNHIKRKYLSEIQKFDLKGERAIVRTLSENILASGLKPEF